MTQQEIKNYLIQHLVSIVHSSASGIDGTTRIKAAVMAPYPSGLPAPANPDVRKTLSGWEMELGIELFTGGKAD